MNIQSTTSAPAPTNRALLTVRRLSAVDTIVNSHFTFAADGDNVVAIPSSDACICTYSFPRTWGKVRISDFLMDRVNFGE